MTPVNHQARLNELSIRLNKGDDIRVFVTHAGYGVDKHLPNSYQYEYVTFLRSPIERVISGYAMFLRQGKVAQDLKLSDFVRLYPKPGWNMQTSFLSGYFLSCHLENKVPLQEAFTVDMLAQAKSNLELHAVVGLTECFDDSLLFLRRRFGWNWPSLVYSSTNIGTNKASVDKFSDATIQFVLDHNQLDMELYAYAKTLFGRQTENYGPRLKRDRIVLSAMNNVLSSALQKSAPAVRVLVRGYRKWIRN